MPLKRWQTVTLIVPQVSKCAQMRMPLFFVTLALSRPDTRPGDMNLLPRMLRNMVGPWWWRSSTPAIGSPKNSDDGEGTEHYLSISSGVRSRRLWMTRTTMSSGLVS